MIKGKTRSLWLRLAEMREERDAIREILKVQKFLKGILIPKVSFPQIKTAVRESTCVERDNERKMERLTICQIFVGMMLNRPI